MATWYNYGYELVYINSDGSIVSMLASEWDAPAFADFGEYLIPWEWTK